MATSPRVVLLAFSLALFQFALALLELAGIQFVLAANLCKINAGTLH